MKILVVEDEQQIRELLLVLLQAEGHAVTVAADGQEGWERFQQAAGDFQVVVADLKMPQLGGIGLLQRMRDAGHRTPCVLMTGHADLTDDASDLLADVTVLYKPFDMDEMLRVVAQVGSAS